MKNTTNSAPSKTASVAPKLRTLMENQSKDYGIDYGFYSEPGAPEYEERIAACSNFLRESEQIKSDKVQHILNLDGKSIKRLWYILWILL